MIKGTTYDQQILLSEDFRLMCWRFFNKKDGIVLGCGISTNTNNVVVTSGYFLISGGYIHIDGQEIIQAGAAGTKTLVFEIDLSKTNTPSAFNQGSWKFITGSPRQDDLFAGGTIYQLPFCQITTNGSSISSRTDLIKQLAGDFQAQIDSKQNRVTKGTANPPVLADGEIYLQYKS